MKKIKEMVIKTHLLKGVESVERKYFDTLGYEYLCIKNGKIVSDLQFVDANTIIDRAKEITITINKNNMGMPLLIKDKNDNVISRYEYDNCNCIRYEDKNICIEFEYDDDNNLIYKKVEGHEEIYYVYSNNKKIFEIMKYDDEISYIVEYKYDSSDNCIQEIKNEFLFDKHNNKIVTTVCKSINYDSNNNISNIFIDNDLYQEFEYKYYEDEENQELSKGDIVIKDNKKLIISDIMISNSGEKIYTLSDGDNILYKAKINEFERLIRDEKFSLSARK